MQATIGIIIISVVQLLLLIAAVNTAVYIHNRYKVRYSTIDVIMPLMQASNLILLLQNYMGRGIFSSAGIGYDSLFIILQVLLISLILIRFIWLLCRVPARRRNLLTPLSVRETIDYLPGGISISMPSGRPILTNRKMNELIYRLTGHTIMNVRAVWEELSQAGCENESLKLEMIWLNRGQAGRSEEDSMYFLMPDDRIWRLRKVVLTDLEPHYIQLDATDITDLYRYSKELHENNERLTQQYKRQQIILANIMQINHEKEILSTKIRIHDDLGRSILTTKQHLSNGTLLNNTPHLAEIWINTIRNLEDFTHIYAGEETSPEIELRKAADMIGCHIDFCGDRPANRKTALLFYAAVREALTNAVMHAKADRLMVSIRPVDQGYHVEISDSGLIPAACVTEGNGLSNLRKRLEQEGASLHIKCEDGVVLVIELPAELKQH